jgi:glutamate-5-semialdehyde dehydrogenase
MGAGASLQGDGLSVRAMAEAAKRASRVLAGLDGARRNAALEAMARGLEAASVALVAANVLDVHGAGEGLSAATLDRLKLDEAKLVEMVEQMRAVARLPEPLGRVLDAIELDKGLNLTKISVPLGVLGVIFEARPDAVTQIAALGIKSGNAVLLKAGREVSKTAEALVRVLREALVSEGLPADSVSLILGRERAKEMLGLHGLVDLVIPRGSKELVEYVQANTRIPVLGHAEGVCHVYVDESADEALALRVIEDAKVDYPAACNAVETVLVHRAIAAEFLPKLAERLRAKGVRLHGDATVRELLRGVEVEAVADWHTEYGELAVSLGVVAGVDEAMEHIAAHGSVHTESVIAEDVAVAERFLREVDAASVMHNASTRFADGFRYGFGAEVGISTSKLHARGPVGMEGLTTYKYVLRGHGQVAGEYRGSHARAFTHKREVR